MRLSEAYLALPRADGDDPDDPDDDPLADIRADIRKAGGSQVLVETTAAAYGEGRGGAPMTDWKPNRFGANPPATLEALRSSVGLAVLSACGVPVSLGLTDADGTSQRESWRRWAHGALAGIAAIIGTELGRKLDTEVSFTFGSLYASDLSGRAASLLRLVKAKMPLDEARAVCGL